MSDHDPICLEADLCGQCDRAVCICKWIAKARADERERRMDAGEGTSADLFDWMVSELDRAEVVAAKLVEVICFDAKVERVLADQIAFLTGQRNAARAEVAALQAFVQDGNDAFTSGRREALADLRAEVEALRDEAKRERDALPKADMRDDPYAYGNGMWAGGRVVGIVEALALIDEDQP